MYQNFRLILSPSKSLPMILNIVLFFFPSYCVFQDQSTGRRIGLAKEKDGLYFFEELGECGRVKSLSSSSFQTKSVMTNKEEIWLQHRRLGHPSFGILQLMFPSLFKGLDIESFHVMFVNLQNINVQISFFFDS